MWKVDYLRNRLLVIWYNPKTSIYYYKLVKFNNYNVGYVNQYGHRLVLVVDIFKDFFYKEKFRNVVIKKLISFLHNLLRE